MNLEYIKRTIGIFWKYFVIIFFVSLVLINWSDIGWVFNYRVASEAISEVVTPEKSGNAESEPPAKEGLAAEVKEEKIIEGNMIEIPKTDILAPIIFFENPEEDEGVIHSSLDRGTVHYPSSALPGEEGLTIILGHSAPENWPNIKYDWVFSKLDDLVWGDKIHIYFNGEKYDYTVREKYFLDRGEEIPASGIGNSVALISCWPPGQNYRRIAVVASLY